MSSCPCNRLPGGRSFFLPGCKILGIVCFSGNDKAFLPIILVFVSIGLLAGECWDQLPLAFWALLHRRWAPRQAPRAALPPCPSLVSRGRAEQASHTQSRRQILSLSLPRAVPWTLLEPSHPCCGGSSFAPQCSPLGFSAHRRQACVLALWPCFSSLFGALFPSPSISRMTAI